MVLLGLVTLEVSHQVRSTAWNKGGVVKVRVVLIGRELLVGVVRAIFTWLQSTLDHWQIRLSHHTCPSHCSPACMIPSPHPCILNEHHHTPTPPSTQSHHHVRQFDHWMTHTGVPWLHKEDIVGRDCTGGVYVWPLMRALHWPAMGDQTTCMLVEHWLVREAPGRLFLTISVAV